MDTQPAHTPQLTWSVVPAMAGITWLYGQRLRSLHARKQALGWSPKQGEIDWNARNIVVYPLIATLGGIIGGFLGLGGGVVLGPLCLFLNLEVSSFSSRGMRRNRKCESVRVCVKARPVCNITEMTSD